MYQRCKKSARICVSYKCSRYCALHQNTGGVSICTEMIFCFLNIVAFLYEIVFVSAACSQTFSQAPGEIELVSTHFRSQGHRRCEYVIRAPVRAAISLNVTRLYEIRTKLLIVAPKCTPELRISQVLSDGKEDIMEVLCPARRNFHAPQVFVSRSNVLKLTYVWVADSESGFTVLFSFRGQGTGIFDPCEFACKDDSCLPSLTLVCDGHFDCVDGWDEADCPLTPSATPVGHNFTEAEYLSAVQILSIVISVLLAVGFITCVLSHYKMGARSWSERRNRPQPSARQQLQSSCPQQQQYTYSLTPPSASMMYTPSTMQERQRLEAAAHHDHQVQLHSVQTDLALDLPHSIALPDGEEHPYSCVKSLKLRDAEQQSELTRSFIRPPPNRTVPEGDPLPPFRSNSVGLLQKPSTPPLSRTLDNAPLVMRSHSMSSSSAQSGQLSFPRGQCTPISNPNVTSHLWIPPLVTSRHIAVNSTSTSSNSSSSNRTCSCSRAATDSKYDSTDPPPPYSDVVNQWDVSTVSRQQNSGV